MFGATQPKYSHPFGRDGMFAEKLGRVTEKRARKTRNSMSFELFGGV